MCACNGFRCRCPSHVDLMRQHQPIWCVGGDLSAHLSGVAPVLAADWAKNALDRTRLRVTSAWAAIPEDRPFAGLREITALAARPMSDLLRGVRQLGRSAAARHPHVGKR